MASKTLKKTKILLPEIIDEDTFTDVPIQRHKGIPIEVLIAHYKQNLSCEQIGEIVGCSPQNVQQRLKKEGVLTLSDFRENKDHIFENLQQKIIKSIIDEDIKKAPFGSRVTAAAILEDKIRLLRGESTENVSVIMKTIQEARARRNKDRPQEGADQG